MKSIQKSSLFTDLAPETAATVNGGYCSKPWGAAYYPSYRSQSYPASKVYPASQSPSFEKAATRLDAVLFE